jgi:hypothetical protein
MPRSRAPLLAAVLFVSSPALAQQSGDTATAQALFDDGKALMKAGRYDEACPKLEESQRLDPGGGTLIALGLCYEDQGRTASAWAEWNLALSDSRGTRRGDRERLALDHIHALESRISRVRVVVLGKSDGLEVRRDGVLLDAALWGTPVPLDPGEHRFEARAPGRKPWQTAIVVRGEASTVDVAVPALEVDPNAPPVPPPAPPGPVAPPVIVPPVAAPLPPAPVPAPSPEPPPTSNGLRPWSYVAAGAGLVSVAVGVGFGLSASSSWSDAHNACPGNRCTSPSAVNEGTSAGHSADASTAFFIVGGVGVAAGVVLYLLSGSHDAPAPAAASIRLTPLAGTVNGLAVQGSL